MTKDSQTTSALVRRLRLSERGSIDLHPSHYRKDCGDAADEIERLEREIERLNEIRDWEQEAADAQV
jgi:hypothetical protein